MKRFKCLLVCVWVVTMACTQAQTPPTVQTPVQAPLSLPSFEQWRAAHQPSDVLLLDRQGIAIGQWRRDTHVRRLAWVKLEDISPALISALLVAEDKRFFNHTGVDWLAVASALWNQPMHGSVGATKRNSRGASSLSMQVAALLDPSLARPARPRSLRQKWDQMQAALALEQSWSKTQVLEAYLNSISFRGELQGVQAASWGLFGKAASGLDKRESAVLAALIRAPSAKPELVARRACEIWRQIRQHPDACDAQLLALQIQHARLNPQPIESLAPHVARLLLQDSSKLLPGERSSLDAGVQRLAIVALNSQIQQLTMQGAEDGAAVVLHNASGQVLAYVGSSGVFSKASQVDAATALRQAGSTLKPFLYGLAFDKGLLSPASVLDDSPLSVGTDAGQYIPRNYNERFSGPVSVRKALASSLNIPAVRALMLTGVPDFHRQLQRLGFSQINPKSEYYGYSLALGSADVSLLDLTNAFRGLANGGQSSNYRFTLGEALSSKTTMQSTSAWLVSHILSDNTARASTFGFDSVLATPFWTAVKTGTSKDMRDNWCVGYSQHFTVGVWVGNASGAPMRNVSGVSGAAPAWVEIMRGLHGAGGKMGALASKMPDTPKGIQAQAVRFEGDFEAPRNEWFTVQRRPMPDVANSMWHTVTLNDGHTGVRIIYPQQGALIAWDPDIPMKQQAIIARHSLLRIDTQGDNDALHWRLDGQRLPSERLPLEGGVHLLSLHNDTGLRLDEVRFEVRGLKKQGGLGLN